MAESDAPAADVRVLGDPAQTAEMGRANDLAERIAAEANADRDAARALLVERLKELKPLDASIMTHHADYRAAQAEQIKLLREIGPPAELSPGLQVWLAAVRTSLPRQLGVAAAVEVADSVLALASARFPELSVAPPAPEPSPAPPPVLPPGPSPAAASPDGTTISVWGGALTDADGRVWTMRGSATTAGPYLDLDGAPSGLYAATATIRAGIVWVQSPADERWRTVRVIDGQAVAVEQPAGPG